MVGALCTFLSFLFLEKKIFERYRVQVSEGQRERERERENPMRVRERERERIGASPKRGSSSPEVGLMLIRSRAQTHGP